MKQSKLFLFLILLLSFLLLGTNSFSQDMKKYAKKAYRDLLKAADKNHDGKLSKAETYAMWKDKNVAENNYKSWDTNKDGYITEEEYVNTVMKITKRSNKTK